MIPTPNCLSCKMENLHVNVYSSSIHNHQKLETANQYPSMGQQIINCRTSIQWITTRQLKVYHLLILKTTWMNLEGTLLSKRSQLRKLHTE